MTTKLLLTLRRDRFVRAAVVLALWCWAGVAFAETIKVFAAASLQDALKDIAAIHEKASGDKAVFNFGASSILARQIEEGAPADIFFSADEARMDALEKRGRIVKETRKSRLSNALVIVVAANSKLEVSSARALAEANVRRVALADPKIVPAGVYARTYLEKLNLWDAVAPKVVPTDNVRAALAAVESGNVEAGIVYKTDAAISRRVKVAYEVPRAEGPEISYPLALVTEAKHPQAAKRFLERLSSKDAAAVFEKFGFVVQPW